MVKGISHGRSARLTADAIALLRSHPWPGNIRELENVLERSLALTDLDVLGPAQIVMPCANSGAAARGLPEVTQLLAKGES